MSNAMPLLKTRRFLPLFMTQLLGALNDNLFKNALVMLITYRLAMQLHLDARLMVTAAAGIFIVPFLLFSATAGQMADRLEKARMVKWVKSAEVLVMGLGGLGFILEDPWLLMAVLFLMGTQSAFFGPLKYAILPDHLDEKELIAGNALVEAGTFLAILIGTLAGGLLILGASGPMIVTASVMVLALLGWFCSLFIPRASIADQDLIIRLNFVAETYELMKLSTRNPDLRTAIIGISWFWFVGAVFLAQFPTLSKEVIGGDEEVVTLFLTTFSIGIGIGSMLCSKLLKGTISTRYAPIGALGLTLFPLDLYLTTKGLPAPSDSMMSAAQFIAIPANQRILLDLLMLSVAGGLYIVPFYTILQSRSDPANRSRVIAGNNIFNALFMVASTLFSMALLSLEVSIPGLLLSVGILNLAMMVVLFLPPRGRRIKGLTKWLLELFYRVEVRGLENHTKLGERAVIIANHSSLLDGILLAVFLPREPVFAIDTRMTQTWWVKPFIRLIKFFPMDPTSPLSIRGLTRHVQTGQHCVIFPEGRLTSTGALMKIYEGPGVVADRSDSMILPVRMDGPQYTPFATRLKGVVRQRWRTKITLTMLPPETLDLPESLKGRRRRAKIGLKLYDKLTEAMFRGGDSHRTLFQALLEARHIHGGNRVVLEDALRGTLTYDRLIAGSLALAAKLHRRTEPGEHVGVLLPNVNGFPALFFGLQSIGRIPALLNHTAGLKNLRSACTTATLKTIITSRRFIELGGLEEVASGLAESVDLLYLEDLRPEITTLDRLRALWRAKRMKHPPSESAGDPENPAVILFTSGSEGAPKGVVLSHVNLVGNCVQLSARIDYNPTDILFNALPLFHAFGLTGGLLLPLLNGIRVFLYPSPLHYRIVPEMVYDSGATILLGTDTFLAGYGRVAHPYDFHTLRYAFAGAEKVKQSTRNKWFELFGVRILEGYGATETAPVLSMNTPMHNQSGSVGRLLPGIEYRLEPVPGIDQGGRLHVSGPNIMKGYLRADRPGVLEPLEDGWYDTGDLVTVDENGYVTIQGRAKRFAKIAGEMVSLTSVEEFVSGIWPDHPHAVISIPDPRKGEQLVLVTERPDSKRRALQQAAKGAGLTELMVPRTVLCVKAVPVLGTGKTNYGGVQDLVAEHFSP
ncbi:MAG: acyl-[ACP]--phospholipid O-acyltransferase [Magnetococcales bacterium]|nr:acyl-[ACP]--phospholipid O-acyltransferase [Magnetococcales bacterium]